MMYVFTANAIKAIQTKKGNLRFKWYETPMFQREEDALKHVFWYITKHKGFTYSHTVKKTVI